MLLIILVLSFLGVCAPSMAMEQKDPEFDIIAKNYQLIKNLCIGVGNLRQNIKNEQICPTRQRIFFVTQMTEDKYPSIYNNPIPNVLFFEHALKYLFMSRLQAQPEDFGKAYSLVNKVWYQTRELYDNFTAFVHDYTLKTFETYLETSQFVKAYFLRNGYKDAIDTGMLGVSKDRGWQECIPNPQIQPERELGLISSYTLRFIGESPSSDSLGLINQRELGLFCEEDKLYCKVRDKEKMQIVRFVETTDEGLASDVFDRIMRTVKDSINIPFFTVAASQEDERQQHLANWNYSHAYESMTTSDEEVLFQFTSLCGYTLNDRTFKS